MVQMQLEGIQSVAELADFEKDSLQQLADNLRKPGGRIIDPDPNAPAGATIHIWSQVSKEVDCGMRP